MLSLISVYCLGMWGYLAYRTFKHDENYFDETSMLALCLVIALSALYVGR